MKLTFMKQGAKVPKGVTMVQVTGDKEDEVVLYADGRREIRIGSGDRKVMTRRRLVLLARRVVVAALGKRIERVGIEMRDFRFESIGLIDGDLAELLSVNLLMAEHQFTEYRSVPDEGWPIISEFVVFGGDGHDVKDGFLRGAVIGAEVNACRRIANLPGGDIIPETLAHEARRAAEGTGIDVTVLDEAAMKKLGMGGVLGVGKGSEAKPKFIIMEYWGSGRPKADAGKPSSVKVTMDKLAGKEESQPIVLVGKGVTFDTGGINLKPSNSIIGMNMDMSGGAAVIHAIAAAAKLKLAKNIVALIPAVENMPSGSSYRPGDVLRSLSGKTIEVLNTDAEGRIILADALTYAKRYDPRLMVDVATLTGAAVVALGERASALFTKDESLERSFRHWGEESGDYVWPLPLWEEYDEEIKGTFGDIANVGKTRYGGAITAAAFLAQFVDDCPWVHLDIAPRMTAIDGEFLAKGASGTPVRLLVKMLEAF